jgi:hypothetical protein
MSNSLSSVLYLDEEGYSNYNDTNLEDAWVFYSK